MIKKIKQSKNKKGDGHLGHLPAYLPGPAPPAGPARHRYPPCRLLPSPEGRGHAPGARGHAPRPPPPCLAASSSPGSLPRRHAAPSDPSHSSSRPRPSALSLSPEPEHSRRHRRRSPRPPSPSRLPDASQSSASPPSSSSSSHATRRAPERRPRRFPLADRRGSSPSIRPLRRAPELADPPCTIPVSPCSVSP